MSNEKIETQTSETATKDQPKYMTSEDLNAALTGHLKRLNLDKKITDALEASLAPFKEQFSQKSVEATQQSQTSEKQSVSTPNDQVSVLQKQIEKMQKQMADKDAQVTAQVKKVRDKEAFTKVCSELTSMGVRAEGVEHLAKVLKSDGKYEVDEDGDIAFVIDEDSKVDLKSGLKAYLDPKINPTMALYLAPKLAGSKQIGKFQNSRSTNGSQQDLSTMDKDQRILMQLQQMKNR